MCNYDSSKTLDQQTWTNWFNAAGHNWTNSGIDTNYWCSTSWPGGTSMLPPLYDLETINPGSPVTYNDSPIRLNSCNLVIFGFAFSENGTNNNLPFEIPFSGRTIFRQGLNTLNYVYPGTSGAPTIATWSDAGMTSWAMMRVMQRKVII
jgi:hypothetical protein